MSVLREIMLAHGVAPHLVENVLAQYTRARKRAVPPDAVWASLLGAAKAVRTSITSNRPKRAGQPVAPLYEAYYVLINKAISKIEEASRLTLDDGQPVQPRDLEARRAKTNAKRAAEDRPILAECRADAWWTWIDPADRQDLLDAVDAYYAARPVNKGKRFAPFITDADRMAVRSMSNALHSAIAEHREMHRCAASKQDGQYTWAETPYSALQLAACSAAYKELNDLTQGAVTKHIKLPKDWRMLCPAPLRQRLREADDNPNAARLTPEEEHVWMPPQWLKQ